VGQVEEARCADAKPLVHFRGGYRELVLGS